ncbi:hypothetical protein LTR36_007010 [Oleoguttula mirabilis]|uniref:Uncharacterized protein n=1 Tax=Oleoguttula mirabilis TaxID=1507867 RepID=A0AAV9JB90_9PEZI|nr:hypothetical protein LTR36_007010 [Oleoguttula mirabilis]
MATVDAEKKGSTGFDIDMAHIKRDKDGLPLVPQPTDDPLDPLNWHPWIKLLVLFEVSVFTLLTLLSASVITPTFQVLSEYLHRGMPQTAYITSIFVLFGGCSAVLWNPVANVYGRRPVYITSLVACIAFLVASGAARSYSELLAFRALNGFFGGVSLSLGSATVWGYIERNLTWRWCLYISAMLLSPLLPLSLLTLPETLYSRRTDDKETRHAVSWKQNLMLHRTFHRVRRLHLIDFVRPWQMLRYPSTLLPTLYYSASFAYGSIMFVITSASIFGRNILSELLAGGFSDWISKKRALQRGGKRKPEDRLLALAPAFVLLPLGIIVEGVCADNSRLCLYGRGRKRPRSDYC